MVTTWMTGLLYLETTRVIDLFFETIKVTNLFLLRENFDDGLELWDHLTDREGVSF